MISTAVSAQLAEPTSSEAETPMAARLAVDSRPLTARFQPATAGSAPWRCIQR
jgi:hypothetical protein